MDTMLLILRSLVNDPDGTQYSDAILNQLLVVAAIIVTKEVYFEQSYTIDIIALTITPDPDNDFSLFTAYKAAILLLQSEIRRLSYQNVKISDGPSSIDISNVTKSLQTNLDSFIAQYDRMKGDYVRSGNLGHFIITPTTVANLSVDTFEQ